MLAIPPFGASSNIALWRANIKPPVELVVDDLDNCLVDKQKALYYSVPKKNYYCNAFSFMTDSLQSDF